MLKCFFSGQLSGNWDLNDDDIGVNEMDIPLDYSWYKTGDTIMTSPLMEDWRPAKGRLKDFYEILVWKEVQDIFNFNRKYRLKVEGEV